MADLKTIKELEEQIAKAKKQVERENKREALEQKAYMLKKELKELKLTPREREIRRRKGIVKSEFKKIGRKILNQAELIAAKQESDRKAEEKKGFQTKRTSSGVTISRPRNSKTGQFIKKNSNKKGKKKSSGRKGKNKIKKNLKNIRETGGNSIFAPLDF